MPFHMPARNTTLRGLGILAIVALWAGWRVLETVIDMLRGSRE